MEALRLVIVSTRRLRLGREWHGRADCSLCTIGSFCCTAGQSTDSKVSLADTVAERDSLLQSSKFEFVATATRHGRGGPSKTRKMYWRADYQKHVVERWMLTLWLFEPGAALAVTQVMLTCALNLAKVNGLSEAA